MTVEEAYKIMKDKYPDKVAIGCEEHPKFYAFNMVKITESHIKDIVTGPICDSVDKVSGEVRKYNCLTDLKGAREAKEIEIKTFI